MTQEQVNEYFEELDMEGVVIFENPDYSNAFIGHTEDGRAVYDYNRMVKCLMEEDGMTEEEAAEFIDYNTLRALPYAGAKGPVVFYPKENIGWFDEDIPDAKGDKS